MSHGSHVPMPPPRHRYGRTRPPQQRSRVPKVFLPPGQYMDSNTAHYPGDVKNRPRPIAEDWDRGVRSSGRLVYVTAQDPITDALTATQIPRGTVEQTTPVPGIYPGIEHWFPGVGDPCTYAPMDQRTNLVFPAGRMATAQRRTERAYRFSNA